MSGNRKGSSIFAGLLLVAIGVLFLVAIYHPALRLGHAIAVYWPALLILWGAAKMIDYLLAQRRGEPRPAIVSGGEAALIVLLVAVLGGFVIRDWVRDRVPRLNFEMPEFGPSYSRSETLPPQTIPLDAHLTINIPRGDIAVQGHPGDQLLVAAQKTMWGMSQTSADRALQNASVRIDYGAGFYRIGPQFAFNRGRGSFDLSVQAPPSASVAAGTNYGDIRIQDISGDVQAHSGAGDIEVRNAGGNVAVNLNRGDGRIAGAKGNVLITGRGDDLNISGVNGTAAVEGPFRGTIRASGVREELRVTQPWTNVSVTRLDGTLESDHGDLSISGASGRVRISTHNSDMNIKDATGPLDIANAHGDIKVWFTAPPREDIHITDDTADVDVTLPAASSFEVEAMSRGGDVASDFSGGQLNVSNNEDAGHISGRVGTSGGPRITIATTYGTIHLRKNSPGR
ncbi:MAG: DUF4097 family beta strand repeat protein [Acidobacteriota bacterium]|nr:DUF4097 family beta strand repeat protein [Acidobacteriota bacterium]